MVCDKGYIWNPSNCAYECDKSCGIGQYLDYKNCACRISVVDKLIEEYTNVIDGDTICNETLTVTLSNIVLHVHHILYYLQYFYQ